MKLQQTEEYLLLIDEEAEINLGDYCLFEDKVLRLRTSWSILYKCKIIAYYPLTKEAKELDLSLLPNPFENKVDIIGLAIEIYGDNYGSVDQIEAFKTGYKAAQSKQFSLNDLLSFARFCNDNHTLDDSDKNNIRWTPLFRGGKRLTEVEMFNNWKQSLSTQQLPKEFIPTPAHQWDRTCNRCLKGFDFTENMRSDCACPHCGSLNHAAVFYHGWEYDVQECSESCQEPDEHDLCSDGCKLARLVIQGQYKY